MQELGVDVADDAVEVGFGDVEQAQAPSRQRMRPASSPS